MSIPCRIGLIVPSSNVTIETEMPRLLQRHASAKFSFHSSRMTMREVSAEELSAMNSQQTRCVDELADAGVDAMLYGCLVALMAQDYDAHRQAEREVRDQFRQRGLAPEVTSSAGALLDPSAISAPPRSPPSPRTCSRWPRRSSPTCERQEPRSSTGAPSK